MVVLGAWALAAGSAQAAKPPCELRISENGQALVDASVRTGFDGKAQPSHTLWLQAEPVRSPTLKLDGRPTLLLSFSPNAFSPTLMLGGVKDASGTYVGYLEVELDIDGIRQVTTGSGSSVNFDWDVFGNPTSDSIRDVTLRIYDQSIAHQRDLAKRTLQPAIVIHFAAAEIARANARAREALATLTQRAAKGKCSTAPVRDEDDYDDAEEYEDIYGQ